MSNLTMFNQGHKDAQEGERRTEFKSDKERSDYEDGWINGLNDLFAEHEAL